MVSPQVFAALAGTSRQAVYKSGDPVKWLKARVRRELVPSRSWRYQTWGLHDARAKAVRMSKLALNRLQGLPHTNTRKAGRPLKASPEALACMLQVKYRQGDTLSMVFDRFLSACIGALKHAMANQWGQQWWKVRKLLDNSWLPRWVHRITGDPPAQWELYKNGKKSESSAAFDDTEGGKWLPGGKVGQRCYNPAWQYKQRLLALQAQGIL